MALIHDVLVVFAFYAIARVSVGNTFIACMLTIVGYSINATIVIFDRIREIWRRKKERRFGNPGQRQHYTDADQKYLHFTDHVYYGIPAVYCGSFFYPRICSASDGRHCMRRLFFRMYYRCPVVCDEDKKKETEIEGLQTWEAAAGNRAVSFLFRKKERNKMEKMGDFCQEGRFFADCKKFEWTRSWPGLSGTENR